VIGITNHESVERFGEEPVGEEESGEGGGHCGKDAPDDTHHHSCEEIEKEHIVQTEAFGETVEEPGQEGETKNRCRPCTCGARST
jgi:hypothetical protein